MLCHVTPPTNLYPREQYPKAQAEQEGRWFRGSTYFMEYRQGVLGRVASNERTVA